jgi:hypothetical protein
VACQIRKLIVTIEMILKVVPQLSGGVKGTAQKRRPLRLSARQTSSTTGLPTNGAFGRHRCELFRCGAGVNSRALVVVYSIPEVRYKRVRQTSVRKSHGASGAGRRVRSSWGPPEHSGIQGWPGSPLWA